MTNVRVARAPVLTLWASIVAERLGWPHDAALTLGLAVGGMTAHVKGARLGPNAHLEKRHDEQGPLPQAAVTGAIRDVPLLGRVVQVAQTTEGLRAIRRNEVVNPDSVERYLRNEFGSQLCAALSAMERLAAAVAPDLLDKEASRLYERFRPDAPSGKPGGGVKGILNIDLIHALVRAKRHRE